MKTKALLIVLVLCMIVSSFAGCSAKYDYDLNKHIVLGSTTDITIKQSEIDDELRAIFEGAVTSGDKKTETFSKAEDKVIAQDKDIVNIDYEVKVSDGTSYNDGKKKEKVDVTLGSESFKDVNGVYIEEIEIGLLEAKIGEKFDIKVKFPEDYGTENTTAGKLNGKDATFTVTVNSIKRTTYPSYIDANIAKYFIDDGYTTVSQFKEAEEPEIIRNLVWQKFYETCTVTSYPEKELKEHYEFYIEDYTKVAESYGITLEYYLQIFGGGDMTSFYSSAAQYAKSRVKDELIIEAALNNNIIGQYDDATFDAKVNKLYELQKKNGYTGELEDFIDAYASEDLSYMVYEELLIDVLVKNVNDNNGIDDDVTKDGLVKEGKGTRLYKKNERLYGWQKYDVNGDGTEDDCYLNEETGYLTIGGAYAIYTNEEGVSESLFYEFDDKGALVIKDNNKKDTGYNGFYTNDGKVRYFVNGRPYKDGWFDIEDKDYYFFDDTFAAVGDVEVKDRDGNAMLGRFDENGVFVMQLDGWVKTDDGIRYYYKNDKGEFVYATKAYEVSGYTFYFRSSNGYLAAPGNGDIFTAENEFAAIFDKLYLFYKVDLGDGIERYALNVDYNDIYVADNGTYYFVEGVGQLGWQNIGGDMYFFSSKEEDGGKMLTGTQTIGGKEYVFGEDGKLEGKLNGFVSDDAGNLMHYTDNVFTTGKYSNTLEDGKVELYYFDNDGYAMNGWIDVNSDGVNDYFARENKLLVSTTEDIDGKTYVFDAEGNCTEKTESESK